MGQPECLFSHLVSSAQGCFGTVLFLRARMAPKSNREEFPVASPSGVRLHPDDITAVHFATELSAKRIISEDRCGSDRYEASTTGVCTVAFGDFCCGIFDLASTEYF